MALKSNAAAERSKFQLSRDFSGCPIFDFFNNINPQEQTFSRMGLVAKRDYAELRFPRAGNKDEAARVHCGYCGAARFATAFVGAGNASAAWRSRLG